jgi:tRNA pseudouridine55 synthase
MIQDHHGILLVDKPADMSSAQVVSRIKSLLKIKKIGHTGTLDPFATGLMICCLNRATRLSRFFLSGHKTYDAVLHLGVETDTQDFTGRPIAETTVSAISEEQIGATVQKFIGTLQQVPPVYSALKHKGVPLYKYARQGKPIQKPARQVKISKIIVREINLPWVRFEISCSAGTYIRTLCSDIGNALACGGHLSALRRLESSGFTVDHALTLKQLEKAAISGDIIRHVIPLAVSLKGMTQWTADALLKDKILNGVPLNTRDVPPEDGLAAGGSVKVIDDQGNLLAVLAYKKEQQRYDYCCVFN